MKEKNFLTWEEYTQKMKQKDLLNFIHNTAVKSINNYWNKIKNQQVTTI